MTAAAYHADELRLIADAVDWLNSNVSDEILPWMTSVEISNPDNSNVLGQAYWQGDGYWAFRTRFQLS